MRFVDSRLTEGLNTFDERLDNTAREFAEATTAVDNRLDASLKSIENRLTGTADGFQQVIDSLQPRSGDG